MNAETFLANFGHVANAPDGVQSLRQLIMASALAGNSSSPNDDLPEDILVQIENARSTYLAEAGRREKPLLFGPPLINEFAIPRGWQWIRVGQVCDLQTGSTPSRQRHDYFGGAIRWLVSGDINQGEIFDCEGRITKAGLENSNCKVLPKDSVLIALNGQGKTRATVALLRVQATCNQSLVAMIPFSSKIIAPEFLLLSLRYRYFEIRDITGQDQRRGLNMGLVSELSVPLAPLNEQKRIVEKVKELMALCDRLETQQQERQKLFPILSHASHNRFTSAPNSANLDSIFDKIGNVSPDDLRKTALSLAVQGKLLSQDLTDESAETLLSRIAERKSKLESEGKIGKEKKHADVNSDEKPFDIPQSWCWAKLSEITELITKGSSPKWQGIEYVSQTGGILFITSENVGNYRLRKLDELKYVDKRFNEIEPRSILKRGDILVNLVGASIGRTAIFDLDDVANINQAVALIRLVSGVNGVSPSFLLHYLNSPSAIDSMLSSRVVNAQPNISLTDMREFDVPIPPLAEQRRIVAKVDQLMALIDTLKKQQQERDHLAETFAKAVVASLTGTQIAERKEKMKAPKTELISNLQLGTKPKAKDDAPLATLLTKAKGELSAKSLWQQSGMTIDAFYQQLKTELARGWIAPPKAAEVYSVWPADEHKVEVF
jgi:type I restriction enzyme S subunit